jgi:hypothetical protein
VGRLLNRRRLLEPIGYVPPAESEAAYYLLQWLATHQRSYEEVTEAWRTFCPKLPGRAFLDRRQALPQ